MSVKTTSSATFSRIKHAFRQAWRKRDFEKAEAKAVLLTRRHPNYAYSWRSLGAARVELKRPEDALDALAQAIQLDPNDAQAFYFLATARFGLKDWKRALEALRSCLALNPDHAPAHALKARVYMALGHRDRAMESIDTARALAPEDATILTHRINILSAARRMQDVLNDCQRLLALDGDNPSFHNLTGVKYCEMGDFVRGAHHFEEALQRRPHYLEAFSNRIFNAHYDPTLSHRDIAALIQRWRAGFSPTQRPARPAGRDRDEHRPLTVGLLSAGLRMHPVGQMITSVLENLPHGDVTLTVYSTSDLKDALTARIRAITDQWHDVAGRPDDSIEALIRQDQVDILIDLSGHTDGNRLRMIAREPAPLIVKWVGGLVNTTGLDAIDYLISDSVETPPGCDADYLEKLIRMPDDYICYMPPPHAPPVGPLPAIENGYVTFGCLNNPAKINPELIEEWARLLADLPASQLLLKSGQYSDPAFRERIWSNFETAGIDRSRITLEGPDHHAAFLDTYNRIDIALDPWPYSGGLTTCEALLMGVPVITLPGPTFAGRHAASHLVNAGLPEWVVDSWEAYRATAWNLAGDLNNLASVRQQLRDGLLRSPVCDAPRFAAHLSAALRGIWQRHCRDLPPAALTFDNTGSGHFEDQALPVPTPTTPARTLLMAAEKREHGDLFQFGFSGKIVALDNGGRLLENDAADALLPLGAFELLVFDPLGEHTAKVARPPSGLQIFPQTTLGDGTPTTFHACLDPAFSATLKPTANAGDGARILTELPVNTIALNRIEGLPSLDWLILDDRHDNMAVLENGDQRLTDTLVIQASVRFDDRYTNQPDLPALCQWARTHGFRLYRLNNPSHRSHLPEHLGPHRQATELLASETLWLPTETRLRSLDDNRKQRLAFLLHTVYGIKDLAYALLNDVDPQQARAYLEADGSLKRTFEEPVVFVVGCGHSGTTLMASLLGAHPNIHCLPRETNWFIGNDKLDHEYPRARRVADEAGERLICEKTPKHLYRIDAIKRRFPNARFVAMVRDGRDVTCSIKKRTGVFDDGVKRWLQDNTWLLKHEQDSTLYQVRYEDLIEDKEGTMARVLAFLGETYTEEVFDFYKKDYNWFGVEPTQETDGVGEQSHMMRRSWQMRQPIHDRRGIWKEALSEQELESFDQSCGDLMRRFGYL